MILGLYQIFVFYTEIMNPLMNRYGELADLKTVNETTEAQIVAFLF